MAAMVFQYGSYRHPAGEVLVQSYNEEPVRNNRGVATSTKRTMQLSGIIVASGAVAIDARVREIQERYALDGFDAALLLPDSTAASRLALTSTGSLYGVQVSGPNFPQDRNSAHYATGLPFTITLTAEYSTIGLGQGVQSSSEAIEQIGDGGQIKTIVVLDNAQPVEHVISPYSPVIVVQSGERTLERPSVLIDVYPNFNQPIWPGQVDRPGGFRRTRHKRESSSGGNIAFAVAWSYTHQFVSAPFIPNPFA